MTSIAQVNLYNGKIFSQEDGDQIWEALEGHVDALGSGQGLPDTLGVLFAPPVLSLPSANVLRVGGFEARSLGNPMTQKTPQNIPYGTATHGSVQGATEVSESGKSRTVVVLARYERLSQGEANNAAQEPVPLVFLHGVAYRVISSDEVVGDEWTAPNSLQDELDAGSVAIAAIKRTSEGDELAPMSNQHRLKQNTIAPLALGSTMGTLAVRQGEYEFTYVPPVSVVADGDSWRVVLDGGEPWYAPLLKGVATFASQGRTMFDGKLSSIAFDEAGTYIARLQYQDQFPGGPLIVLCDGEGIANAEGEFWEPVDERGYAINGEGGFYPAQPFDIPIAVIAYNGTDDPEIEPIANGPINRWEVPLAPLYSVGQSEQDPNLDVVLTLPEGALGGSWGVEVSFDRVDENQAPPGLGHAHDLRYQIIWASFDKIRLRLLGQWSSVGGNGELSVPSSFRYFRPGARVFLTRFAPSLV